LIDVDALSAPLGDDEPAGPNLEYDGNYLELEAASRGKPEQQFGDTIVPAEEPDWKAVARQGLSLLERTRDLRIAALVTRALTRTQGLAGFAAGMELLARLTCDLWAHVHPQLDPDDNNDPFMRVSALSLLADGEGMQRGEGILRDLRSIEIVSVRGVGTFQMRDLELALEMIEGNTEAPTLSRAQLEGLMAAAAQGGEPDHAGAALASLERLLDFLRATIGSVETPDASMLRARLRAISQMHASGSDGGESASESAGYDDESAAPGDDDTGSARPSGRRAQALSGEIHSREDAIRALNLVCAYLERHEPTNPAPLLIKRAQKLMNMSFVQIIQEMTPEGMDSLAKIAGADQVSSSSDGY